MDHDATREQLELAAAEPGGLERLMAGDTATAQAVAAHVAGCPSCTDELARLERAARLIRRVVLEQPPADLRERTLAVIRTAGVQRGDVSGVGNSSPAVTGGQSARVVGRGRFALGWVAVMAAAVIVSVVATSLIVGRQMEDRLVSQAATIGALQKVAVATLQVTAEPDARRVALAGADPALDGDLIFSPSTSELVVVATGLTEPPAGQEYRCWVETAGARHRIGKMFFSDDLAYWIGPASAVEGLEDDATFGVSLVDASGTAIDTEPVLGGGL